MICGTENYSLLFIPSLSDKALNKDMGLNYWIYPA